MGWAREREREREKETEEKGGEDEGKSVASMPYATGRAGGREGAMSGRAEAQRTTQDSRLRTRRGCAHYGIGRGPSIGGQIGKGATDGAGCHLEQQ